MWTGTASEAKDSGGKPVSVKVVKLEQRVLEQVLKIPASLDP
jgi:hypothetical protein